jgi:Ca-activated chloride channel family protein
MEMEGRLELVKDALAFLVDRLGPDDSVAIVEFGTEARVVLRPTSAAEPWAIVGAIDALHPSGSTNAQAGLELGYDMAVLGRRPGARDRVILASDGVANVGLTDAESILGRIAREVDAGVDLVTVGVGMGNFNDVLLEQLADHGNGFYAYVNDHREAERLFVEDLTATLQTVARDARVQVEWRSETVRSYRLLGYENRTMADGDFRDPSVDAGEVGVGHHVTALYEVEPITLAAPFLGTVRLRWIDPETGHEEQLARDIGLGDLASDFDSASGPFRLAATVAAFAEVLRESPWAGSYSLWDVAREVEPLERELASDDVRELRWLIEQAARLYEERW